MRIKPLKPFRIFDGEGRNFPDGTHRLTLLANSDKEYVENENGLSTIQCLEFLTLPRKKAINVWFSFGYDVNQIVRDLPFTGKRGTVEQLWNTGRTWNHGTFIKYVPRKFLTIRYKGRTFSSADTFSFFQTSFLKACVLWGVDASGIVKGKEGRGDFASWSMEDIRAYNFEEMDLALDLLNRLRGAFCSVNLEPRSWHGPGAIAMAWLAREGIGAHYGSEPEEMRVPIRHAYFGGRIDTALVGEAHAYQYDLTSAYPAGLTDCISLAHVEWRYSEDATVSDRHALYHVTWDCPRFGTWNPLPWRAKDGAVLFPPVGEGWYWGVEVLAAESAYPARIKRLGAWYPLGDKTFPFKEAILRDYKQRFAVGKDTGSGIAIKLGLNSIYGKLCQHATSGKDKVPRWQNYVWAGYVTAHTRAKIISAIAEVGSHNALAVATDGLFTRVSFGGIGDGLGGWEDKGSAPTLFVAPGVYAVFRGEKATVVKRRGFPANINYGHALRTWGCTTELNNEGVSSLHSPFISYITMGKALAQKESLWNTFQTLERTLGNVTLVGTSKRIPAPGSFGLGVWREFPLLLRSRNEEVISYAYEWKEAWDPKEEKE